jgi:hypothetical protein
MYYVSHDEATEFCRRFTESERRAGRLPADWEYALPTEAQWEYACRAGTTTRYSFGDNEGSLGEFAWFFGNSNDTTHPVGQKSPNGWDLHDMHGSVWEWCADWYADKLAGGEDPRGPATAADRVARGGSWGSLPGRCGSALRSRMVEPGHWTGSVGFRLALVQSRRCAQVRSGWVFQSRRVLRACGGLAGEAAEPRGGAQPHGAVASPARRSKAEPDGAMPGLSAWQGRRTDADGRAGKSPLAERRATVVLATSAYHAADSVIV